MTAEELIDTLEQRALLPADVVASLRQQVAKSLKIVAPEAIAKLLVDKGRLTSFQAEQLLKPSAAKKPAAALDEEMMLAPLDDLPGKHAQSAAKKPAAEAPSPSKAAPAKDKPATAPKLAPAAAKAAPSSAKPAAASGKPPPAGKPVAPSKPAPAKPTSSAVKAPAAKAASSVELEPLTSADDFGLAPSGGGPLDDMLGESNLGEPNLGETPVDLQSGPILPTGRRRSGVPSLIWFVVGGGLLLVVLILGVLIALGRSNGDAEWQLAERDFTSGADQDAIAKLDAFLEKFPNHPRAGTATVYRGMARLRQAAAAKSDWDQQLSIASEVLPKIVDQPDFTKVREPLGKMLPEIAVGLAQKAKDGSKGPLDQRRQHTAAALQALALATDPRYTPDSQKPWGQLQAAENDMAPLARAVDRDTELDHAAAEIRTTITAGNISAAFARRDQLLDAFPELRTDSTVEQLDQELAQGEAKSIKVDTEPHKAETKPLPSPVVSTIVFAGTNGKLRVPAAAEKGPVAVVFAEGTAYWFNSADGTALGRAFLGYDSGPPLVIESSGGADYVAYDAVHQELVRFSARSAVMRWRQPLGGPIAGTPAIFGGHVFAVSRSGRLLMLDTESGDVLRTAQFAEPFSVGPAVSADGAILYLASERGNVFLLTAEDFRCSAATYLGSELGSVMLPPTVIGKQVVLIQSQDFDNSVLRFIAVGPRDATLKPGERIPVAGRITSPPFVDGSRLFVATDRGALLVLAAATQSGSSLAKIASLPATDKRPQPTFVAAEGNHCWLGGSGIAQYELGKPGDALRLNWERLKEDRILQSPLSSGKLLIVAHSRPGVPGVWVTAIDAQEGKSQWETAFAASHVTPPLYDAEGKIVRYFHPSIGEFKLRAIPKATQEVSPPFQLLPISLPPLFVAATVPWGRGMLAIMTGTSDPDKIGGQRLSYYDSKDDEIRPSPWPDAVSTTAVALGAGILLCNQASQVLLLDVETGEQLAGPFVPRTTSGAERSWRRPCVISGKTEVVLTDGRSRIYRLGIKGEKTPVLAALADEALPAPIASDVAVNGEFAFAADDSGKLQAFSLADLKPAKNFPLDASAVWGPTHVGDVILVATDRELFCFDAKPDLIWKKPLPAGPPVGEPLLQGNELLLATATGTIWRVDRASGEEKGKLDLGQPLASGPVEFEKHIVVAAADGSLLIVKVP